MPKEILMKRDFGGRKRHDWFKLHETVKKEKGLTNEQAKKLAQELRDDGFAVKIDPLAGKSRKGVYYRKRKERSPLWTYHDVELFTVPNNPE